MSLALLGTGLSAEEAKDMGIVYAVHDSDDLYAQQEKIALRMARRSKYGLMLMKKIMTTGLEETGYSARQMERVMFNVALSLPGANESLQAIKERRKANFTGI